MAKIGSYAWEGKAARIAAEKEAADEAIAEALEVYGDRIRCPRCARVGIIVDSDSEGDWAACRHFGCWEGWKINHPGIPYRKGD